MTNDKPSIVFMGTPDFATPALEKIHQRYGVRAVVTTPDKPKGRGLKMSPSAVKTKALELGIEVLQPVSMKDSEFESSLRDLSPDIIVVIAFRILPAAIFTMPTIATFNIHGSILPKYRGAAPINHAVINGERKTGLTAFKLAEKVDTGSIIDVVEIDVSDDDTFGDLYYRLSPLAADLALTTCEKLISGNYELKKQNDDEATAAPKIFPENCLVDWTKPAERVRNLIHGVSPAPGARAQFDGKTLKILRAKTDKRADLKPGEFIITKSEFLVGCGERSIRIIELQPEGKKSMPVEDFLRGYRGAERGSFNC